MGANPEELEQDIARTRANLGRTLDELERKLSARRILEDNRQKISIALGAIAALMTIIVGSKVVRARRNRD